MSDSWLDRNRNTIFIAIVLMATAGTGMFFWFQPESNNLEIIVNEPTATPTVTAEPLPTATATPAPVRVYVTGAVVQPDVYYLPQGSIIKDLIEAAGGLTEDVDPEQINLATEVQDQQHVHVPRLGETDAPPTVQDSPNAPSSLTNSTDSPTTSGGLINLNTAPLEQLDSLPRIGPSIAQRIIDHRTANGPFQTVDQIKNVSGIGDATFAQIEGLITVE